MRGFVLGGNSGYVFMRQSGEVIDFMSITGSKFFVFQLGKVAQVVETLFKGIGITALKNMDFFIEVQVGAYNAFRASIKELP